MRVKGSLRPWRKQERTAQRAWLVLGDFARHSDEASNTNLAMVAVGLDTADEDCTCVENCCCVAKRLSSLS